MKPWDKLDQVTQQNAAMVEQATAAANSLGAEARQLMQLIGQFTIGSRIAHTAHVPALRVV
jgi:methyl-accepting chemotaxis protein